VPFSDARKDSLAEMLSQAEAELHIYPGNVFGPEMHSDTYGDWLESLPRPCGLLLVSAQRAPGTLLHCERRGIRVPEDLAVLGVEEDPLLCRLTNPPLSTIDHNTERVGFEAARMLDMLMAGQAVDPPVVRIPPRGVVRRQSTQMLATRHEGVVRAVRYIREHIEEPLTVAEVLRHVPVGRRSLDMAFQRPLGRGIGEEIRRQKLRLAQDLLVETTLPMADIAVRVGFSSASHMTHVFARELGTSPTAWRDEHGLR
jgi:LacI family transcriptional regulator